MEKLLNYLGTELSYCNQCNNPTVVGIFLLKGWKHKFFICDSCLREMASIIIKEWELNVRKEVI